MYSYDLRDEGKMTSFRFQKLPFSVSVSQDPYRVYFAKDCYASVASPHDQVARLDGGFHSRIVCGVSSHGIYIFWFGQNGAEMMREQSLKSYSLEVAMF